MQFTVSQIISSNKVNIAVTWWQKILTKNSTWIKTTIKILKTTLNIGSVTVISDVKVRYHCHITGKYRGSTSRDCNTNAQLNHKIPVLFHYLKNYDSHLNIRKLGNFHHKINVIPNRLEKYMSFLISDTLSI